MTDPGCAHPAYQRQTVSGRLYVRQAEGVLYTDFCAGCGAILDERS